MTDASANQTDSDATDLEKTRQPADSAEDAPKRPREIGGRDGPDPTRFGDWEKDGRCVDF